MKKLICPYCNNEVYIPDIYLEIIYCKKCEQKIIIDNNEPNSQSKNNKKSECRSENLIKEKQTHNTNSVIYSPQECVPVLNLNDKKYIGNSLNPFITEIRNANAIAPIIALGWYIPSKTVFTGRYSKTIRNLKSLNMVSINIFVKYLQQVIKPGTVLTAVPPHNEMSSSAIRELISILKWKGFRDASGCLYREKSVPKASAGGHRSDYLKHLETISVRNSSIIISSHVLLIDDVLTTGASILACRRKLLSAGASDVTCLVLARTRYSKGIL